MPDTETPTGELTLRTLAMPADVNVNGDIFGGWLLSLMDHGAGLIAARSDIVSQIIPPRLRAFRLLS